MEAEIKKKFINSMFKFKKTIMGFSSTFGINMVEFVILKAISEVDGSEEDFFTKAREHVHVSKAAISQGVGALEKNGYIFRTTDLSDRRKIVLKLTESGKTTLISLESKADEMLNNIIERFTLAKTNKMIDLINEFSELQEIVCLENNRKTNTVEI